VVRCFPRKTTAKKRSTSADRRRKWVVQASIFDHEGNRQVAAWGGVAHLTRGVGGALTLGGAGFSGWEFRLKSVCLGGPRAPPSWGVSTATSGGEGSNSGTQGGGARLSGWNAS